MRSLPIVSCLFVLTAGWAVAADVPVPQQENWPQWRGPLANGVAPAANPPTKWDENTNIKWKVRIPGEGNATPIVWGNQIILNTAIQTDREGEPDPVPDAPPKEEPKPDAKADGKDKGKRPRFNINKPKHFFQFVVMSLDRSTGKVLWQHTAKEAVPHEGHHPDGSYASASPMTDGKQIYVSFGSRGVHCYDMQGNLKWSRDFGRMIIYNTFGEGSSPVVHGDSVIVNWDHQNGSFIVCLDAATGETKWKVDREENTTWATPLLVDHGGRTQVIVHGSRRVRSYDLANGELIWSCGGQALSAIPCPVTDGKLVFVMTGFMGNALYAIPLDSQGDITEFAEKKEPEKIAWKRKEPGTPYVPSPLLDGELLYFTAGNKGILSCINGQSGEALINRERLEGIQNIYASPVAAADRIYLVSREGTALVIKRAPKLEILSTNKLEDRFDSSPVAVGNQLLLRGAEHLYSIVGE